MALIEFDDNQKHLMRYGSQAGIQPTEYAQGDYSALFQSMNSFAALAKRGDFERMEVDATPYEGIAFNRDNLYEQLKKQGKTPDVIDQVMSSHLTGWEDSIRRTAFVEHMNQVHQQVSENFSVPGMLAAGIPMALLDLDMLLINPTLAGVNKFRKAMNISSRMGKFATHAGAGAFIGAESMLTYEAATGMYHDDSLINSALIGMALNGTLGTLLERGNKQGDIIRHTDKDGNLKTREEAKVEELAEANGRLDRLNTVITDFKALLSGQKETKAALKASERRDLGRAKTDARMADDILKQEKEYAKKVWQDTKSPVEALVATIKTARASLRKAESGITKATKATADYNKATADLKVARKEATPIKGQVTKLTNQMAKLADATDEASQIKAKELGKKLADQQKRLRKQEAKITRIETRMGKYDQDTPKQMELLKANRAGFNVELVNRTGDLAKAQRKRQEAKAEYDKRVTAHREHSRVPKEVREGFETKTLTERLAAYDVPASPEGLRQLMQKQNVLTDDIAKMSDDDFNLSTVYGIRKEQQNYVEKLNRELEEVNQLKDFTQSATFKRLPEWARKLVISPIENLLNSDNNLVSGFASLLHSGTLHHGKINTHNAWNIRTELDNQLNRMHKAMIFLHRQAVKEGYAGKLEEFETEVAEQAFKVTGKMQRDMYTGISGDIVGLERMELAQQRAASLQRQHASGNKHIDDAVDEYLNYYEAIHARGQALGMEAFKGSVGKAYIKRVYSRGKIEQMGEANAIQHLVDAQVAFARATNSEIHMEEFISKATTAVQETLNRDFKIKQVTDPLGLPKQSTTSSLKQRSIDAFDDDLAHVLEGDVVGTSTLYGLGVHGRLALKEKLGVDTSDQVEGLIQQLGATQKEVDNLRVLIQTIAGTREISKNPYDPFTRIAKAASTYSSAMHTLAFAVPTVTELASMAKEFGWGKTMDSLIGKPQEIYKIYREGTPSDKNTIEMMVSYGDAYFATKANRFDVESTFDSVGRVQEFMDDIVRKEAVFGGLLPLTDMMRMATASLSVDFLAKLSVAKNISPTDVQRLGDMGFGVEDLTLIKERLKVQPDGRIGNTDRKTWGSLDKKITYGVQTMVERTILHPNGATLPKFMTNMNEGQFLPRVMFKFMRFPFESYERLLGRGMQEADAKQLLALGGNVAMWTMLLAAKDALKDEDKQKYTGEDGGNQLMMDSFLYNSFTALPISAMDTASGLLTGENMTNDYRYRLGGAVQTDYEALVRMNPGLAIPFYKIHLGDAVANSMAAITGLEELNRED